MNDLLMKYLALSLGVKNRKVTGFDVAYLFFIVFIGVLILVMFGNGWLASVFAVIAITLLVMLFMACFNFSNSNLEK